MDVKLNFRQHEVLEAREHEPRLGNLRQFLPQVGNQQTLCPVLSLTHSLARLGFNNLKLLSYALSSVQSDDSPLLIDAAGCCEAFFDKNISVLIVGCSDGDCFQSFGSS